MLGSGKVEYVWKSVSRMKELTLQMEVDVLGCL